MLKSSFASLRSTALYSVLSDRLALRLAAAPFLICPWRTENFSGLLNAIVWRLHSY